MQHGVFRFCPSRTKPLQPMQCVDWMVWPMLMPAFSIDALPYARAVHPCGA